VGANAFRHESGIHQDGVIKAPVTFEIMDPRRVGVPASVLTLGKLSGRHAFRDRLAELGYTLDDAAFARAFAAFKELADKKKEVTDRDIESLVAQELRTSSEIFHLEHMQVSCGSHTVPTATVKLKGPGGEMLIQAAMGDGPVDAVYRAIDSLVGLPNKLVEFTIKSVTGGIDAIGEVLVRIESEGRTFAGRGASTDIILASAKAYLNALNRLAVAVKAAESD
jgi:2-isopropylmalate synthase